MHLNEVLEFLQTADKQQLEIIASYTSMNRKQLGKQTVRELTVGDKVTWTSPKTRGKYANKTFKGTVCKINTTRVKVDTGSGIWNVPGSMLEVV
jgi:hypothetical protein